MKNSEITDFLKHSNLAKVSLLEIVGFIGRVRRPSIYDGTENVNNMG